MLQNFSKTKIVVVGDVMLDVYFTGEVNRISPEAPVPVVKICHKSFTLGGAGNVALNLVKLGCKVSLFGVRGADVSGELMATIIKDNSIKDCLIVDTSHITTVKTRIIAARQQLIRLDEEEIWDCGEKYKQQLLKNIEEEIKDADGVILSDYAKGVLISDLSQSIINLCKLNNKLVFVDPKRKNWQRYSNADFITPNIAELEEISGTKIGDDEDKLLKEAYKIRQLYGIRYVLVTRGPKGMCLVGPQGHTFIMSVAKEVFDVTGAGDTVIATFAVAVCSGVPINISAEISNLAAGIVVGKLGSQPITIMELESAWKNKEKGLLASSHKILTLHSAEILIQTWKVLGEKIVVTQGVFSPIKHSQVRNLIRARELGDKLIVLLYPEEIVKKQKAAVEYHQKDTADILSSLECVDLVILLNNEPLDLVFKTLKPDILVKGNDDFLDNLITDEQVGNCIIEKF